MSADASKPKKRVLVSYGVDIDAIAGWLGSYKGEDSTSDISRGKSVCGPIGTAPGRDQCPELCRNKLNPDIDELCLYEQATLPALKESDVC